MTAGIAFSHNLHAGPIQVKLFTLMKTKQQVGPFGSLRRLLRDFGTNIWVMDKFELGKLIGYEIFFVTFANSISNYNILPELLSICVIIKKNTYVGAFFLLPKMSILSEKVGQFC